MPIGRGGSLILVAFSLLSMGCTYVGDPVPGAPAHHREYGYANPSGATGTDALQFVYDRTRLAFAGPEEAPAETLSTEESKAQWSASGEADAVQWLGHSSLRLRVAGIAFVIDPVVAEIVSPLPPFGPPRATPAPLRAAELDDVRVILISHDHYDHFEPRTVNALAERAGTRCLLPLDVAVGEGLVCDLQELDWHESVEIDGVVFTLLPAQHESGRGIFDRDRSLWGAWLVEAPAAEGPDGEPMTKTVYLSGDGGYGAHFAALGDSAGTVDLAAIAVGGYEPHYNTGVHMDPSEAMRAIHDLGARRALMVHWGTYPLGLESGGETVERVTAAAEEAELTERIVFLKIGEVLTF